jgi:hypothetical protein
MELGRNCGGIGVHGEFEGCPRSLRPAEERNGVIARRGELFKSTPLAKGEIRDMTSES